MMTRMHINTFTYGMSPSRRAGDVMLYESLSYEDRLLFDQYNALVNYVVTRPNVDLDIVEAQIQRQYEDAMRVRSEATQGNKNEEIKQEGCQ